MWNEHIIERRQNIDPATGKLSKRVYTVYIGEGNCCGIQCTNSDCDYMTDISGSPDYPQFKTFEDTALSQINKINDYKSCKVNQHCGGLTIKPN